jgi:hypothetical protein
MYATESVTTGLGRITQLETQYYDVFLYFVYPWIMTVLFLVAGMCSRYYLERHTDREFLRSRTTRLLVPSTAGLFAFQFIQGYVNLSLGGAFAELAAAGGKDVFGGKDELVKVLSAYAKDVATEPALGDEPSEDFMWIHRTVDGIERYFVAAGTNGWRGKVTFRAKGTVSIFDPVLLERTAWRNGDVLEIPPSRSVFVEFGGDDIVPVVERAEVTKTRSSLIANGLQPVSIA